MVGRLALLVLAAMCGAIGFQAQVAVANAGGIAISPAHGAHMDGARAATPDPQVFSISPDETWTDVSTLVTLTGINFQADTEVLVNGYVQSSTFVNSTQMTCTLHGQQPGTDKISVRRAGSSGSGDGNLTFRIKDENTFPAIQISGADDQWHAEPVTLTINVTDSQSGVRSVLFSVNAGLLQTLTGNTITIPGAFGGVYGGTNLVSITAYDNSGHRSDTYVEVRIEAQSAIVIDTVAPGTVAPLNSVVTLSGGVVPVTTAAQSVAWVVDRQKAGEWGQVATGNAPLGLFQGAKRFSFTYQPTQPGSYRASASFVNRVGGPTTTSDWFAFSTPYNKPVINSLQPLNGPVGTTVTVTGTGFTDATSVKFAGFPAEFTAVSDTQISTTVPTGAESGELTVTTPGGTAISTSLFTVTGAPVVKSFAPTSGQAGTSVTVKGTGLSGATRVAFGQALATFRVVNDTELLATVPSGAVTAPIVVTTVAGTTTSDISFVVTGTSPSPSPSPTTTVTPSIASMEPTSGPVGTEVQLVGSGFDGATDVRFGGAVHSAVFTVDGDSRIRTVVPADAISGPISVITTRGTAIGPRFEVTGTQPKLSLRLKGPLHGKVRVGKSVLASVLIAQYESVPDDAVVVVSGQRKKGNAWVTVQATRGNPDYWLDFRRVLRPMSAGRYRVKASVTGSEAIPVAATGWTYLTAK